METINEEILRDLFAASAIAGAVTVEDYVSNTMAERAYAFADLMLDVRRRTTVKLENHTDEAPGREDEDNHVWIL